MIESGDAEQPTTRQVEGQMPSPNATSRSCAWYSSTSGAGGGAVSVRPSKPTSPSIRPIASNTQAVLDLIYNEIVLREEAGESPALEDYLRRFPELAPELKLQFEVEQAIQSTSAPRGREPSNGLWRHVVAIRTTESSRLSPATRFSES